VSERIASSQPKHIQRRFPVAIELNHTIVPARDKVAAAKFFARILGLPFDKEAVGYFAPVRVNNSLTMDFADSNKIAIHHYAFKVSEEDFDAIFGRIQTEGIPYGSGPYSLEDMDINHRGGGRGVYFRDPDGHILELLTVE
jgi:catechol 2,3-dioxygenase-like lactoylglutathione lyase family enzyme